MKQTSPPSTNSRQRKQALRLEIDRLAAEGLSSREIAAKLGLSHSTVCRWRRTARRQSSARQGLDQAEAIERKIEHYRSISGELLNAWRLSQADKQVRVIEDSGPADDPAAAKKKRTVRTETQTGNAGYLAKAMDAENRIEVLEQRLAALERAEAAGPGGGLARLADLTDGDLEKLTPDELETFSDDQLFDIGTRLRARFERSGGKIERPLLTNEELRNMNDEQLTACELRLQAEMARGHDAESPAYKTEPVACGASVPPPRAADPENEGAEQAPRPEPAAAETAGAVAAVCGAAEEPKKADPPRLTWDQKRKELLREKAERKRRLLFYTDPRNCAF